MVLEGRVLVLNRNYQPVNVTSVKRAICMMVVGAAKAINEDYQIFDFEEWIEIEPANDDDAVSSVSMSVLVPKIVVLQAYDRLPRLQVKFSRLNVYDRDEHTCQYCHQRFGKKDLNLDHVVPRSQGGPTSWENVVTSCKPCNGRKGPRTPAQANMNLLKEPKRPKIHHVRSIRRNRATLDAWRPFLEGWA